MDIEKEWLDNVICKVKLANARKVLVQAPDGLKTSLQDIGTALQDAGIEAVLSCEPCYGACDLKDAEARRLGCELLLHIGHADMGVRAALPVIYEEFPMEADPSPILEAGLGAMNAHKCIGLATTVQYIYLLDSVKRLLEHNGMSVFIGKGTGRAKYPGQILGCDQSAAKSVESRVDAFLFMGTGRFHALGLVSATGKPVFFLDLENRKLTDMATEKERIERIKFANIEKARECKNFGILVSTKPGQSSLAAAETAKDKLETKGRAAWILAMDNIAPGKLLGLKIECLVNCACPRLTEDAGQFRKPMIGPEDVDKL